MAAVIRPGPAAAQAAPVIVAPGLAVNPRVAWSGDVDEAVGLDSEEVRFLLVHHTAGSNDYAPRDVPGIIREIHRFHTGPERGWPDICYHFFVDRYGAAWEARSGSLAGPVVADATGGNQGYAQLCCLLGDFTSAMPTPEAIETLALVLAWLAGRYAVPTDPAATVSFQSRGSNLWPAGQQVTTRGVAGHRDMSQTACPGDAFYPYVRDELPVRVHTLASSWQSPTPASVVPASTAPSTPGPTAETTTPSTTDDPAAPPVALGTIAPAPSVTAPIEAPPAAASPTPAPHEPTSSDGESGGWRPAAAGTAALAAVAIGVARLRARSSPEGVDPHHVDELKRSRQ